MQQDCKCIIGKDYPKPIVDHSEACKENKGKMHDAYDANKKASSASENDDDNDNDDSDDDQEGGDDDDDDNKDEGKKKRGGGDGKKDSVNGTSNKRSKK